MSEVVISFVLLDDLSPSVGPIHRAIKYNKEEIITFIKEIENLFYKNSEVRDMKFDERIKYCEQHNKRGDSSRFFNENLTDDERDGIAEELLNNQYYVRNRVEKYYVIAFAINYTCFDVYSKDCDKELVSWGDDKVGEIKGIITDPHYNENPVIKLLSSLLHKS